MRELGLRLRDAVRVGGVVLLGGACAASIEAQVSPVNLGPLINSAARDAEPTFTADGNTMYFNCFGRMGGSGNDICVTHRVSGQWTEPEIVQAVSTESTWRWNRCSHPTGPVSTS